MLDKCDAESLYHFSPHFLLLILTSPPRPFTVPGKRQGHFFEEILFDIFI